jgi:4-amino-4-deoxy-L-arabinose transferase-like glycosyltransferase
MVFLIILCAVLLYVPLLGTPLTYRNDSWREADTASIARLFYRDGFHILYPQIYWGGNGPGYVETELQYYPLLISLLYAGFGEHYWFGRLISLLFMTGAFVLFYLLARRLLRPVAALWALGFFVVTPLVARYSVAYMPEAALLCFYLGSLYWLLGWVETQKPSDLWLGSICVALGTLLKPTDLLAGVIVIPLLVMRRGWGVFKLPRLWIALAICLVPPLVWYAHAHAIFLRYGNTFGVAAGGDTKWGDPSYWLTRSFYRDTILLNAKWVFSQVGLVLFPLGVILAIKRRDNPFLVLSFFVIGFYYLAIARAAEKYYSVHYYIQAVPIAAVGMGTAVEWLLSFTRRRLAAGAVAVVVAVPTLYFSAQVYADRIGDAGNRDARAEIACAQMVHRLVAPEEKIIVESVSEGTEHGRPKNFQDPRIFFHADRYGWILPRDGATPAKVEELEREGARYFITLHERLTDDHPLASFLSLRAKEISEITGMARTWDIFRLAPPDSVRTVALP